MKSIFTLVLILLSLPILANPLTGEWSYCHIDKDGSNTQHVIEFGKNNVEFEMIAFLKPSKGPCKGTPKFLFGTFWYYEVENDHFISTAFSHYAMLGDKNLVSRFNKNQFCSTKDWKVDRRVDCSDDKFIVKELGGRGYKTKTEYLLKGNELHIIEDGQTKIYKRYN